MPLRYYIAPVIGSGTRQDPYTLKTYIYVKDGSVQLAGGFAKAAYWWQTDLSGLPVSQWGLSAVRASSFTAIDNDPTIDDLFGGFIPVQIDSPADMVSFLKANTLGNLTPARKTRVFAVLDKYFVNRSDFTDSTSLWDVLTRVFQNIFIFNSNEDLNIVMANFFI